jgi:hypothetical protein
MSYSPAAQFLLFLVQWTDCSLAGALGLLRILIYKVLSFVRAYCFVSSQLTLSSAGSVFSGNPYSSLNLCFCWPAGLCGWNHHHVHPREEGQHQGVLR